ncbi:sterol desaturase/sphingolipid hydroxylase (fatty acid hydroxylase superfamily) [Rhodoferax ferrireducens]|uniref:Sterol desaturase/sphingolipid hydroxylase (Fatty acid hydroxylase superfamily) n=1 Tax=Rhodoferax ferrireducens TaxID=192843 RepID=A0ABU2C4F6_9BURK|nr:sterol desaturase family protein [Rhodoferax ferrireducens]MDR7376208.1 sterol desaturase/sphingolipid hydroxylase (fatty acid hydroxylase superfamily) [Rhodoferax ferrireducens]
MIDFLTNLFSDAQQWLFEALIQPLVFGLGFGGWVEDAYTATGWLLVGVLQLVVLVAVFGPLQRWRPAEPVHDRAAIRTDVLYTLIHRLGLFRLALFFTLDPLMDEMFGALRVAGMGTWHLDALWPGVTDQPVLSFALYLVVFDFLGYWVHRGQHHFNWWWSLHALHHSQRQMTLWSDNRNHLLDDILGDVIVVLAAQLIGVAPGQFIAIVAFTQLSESLQHANLRLWFGKVGERLWVSPRFHRLHHSIGLGHESAGKNTLGGHNFGILLPWWDMLFGTANFELRYDPTGIRDQLPEEGGRDYGRGFWRQQWLGVRRLWGSLR